MNKCCEKCIVYNSPSRKDYAMGCKSLNCPCHTPVQKEKTITDVLERELELQSPQTPVKKEKCIHCDMYCGSEGCACKCHLSPSSESWEEQWEFLWTVGSIGVESRFGHFSSAKDIEKSFIKNTIIPAEVERLRIPKLDEAGGDRNTPKVSKEFARGFNQAINQIFTP